MPCFQLGHFCCFPDCSALLKQREKILDKKNKVSATSVTTSSPPPAPDANFLNNILNASAAMKARANKRPLSADSGRITQPAPAASSLTRGHAIKKGPTKVETHKTNVGSSKLLPRATDSSVGTGRMQSNISKVNANISSLNKASSSISNMSKAAANLSSTSKGFSTVGKKKELTITRDVSKDYSVSCSDPKFNSLSSQSAKFQTYSSSSESAKLQTYSSSSEPAKLKTYSSSSEPAKFQTYSSSSEPAKLKTYSSSSEPAKFQTYSSSSEPAKFQTYSSSSEPAKYTNIDHSSYIRSPTYNNNTEEILTVSSEANTNFNISLQNKTIQYSNIKSEPQARYGNVEESGRWITNFKKKGIFIVLVLSSLSLTCGYS